MFDYSTKEHSGVSCVIGGTGNNRLFHVHNGGLVTQEGHIVSYVVDHTGHRIAFPVCSHTHNII